ncbi:MAG: GSCFA domain-containing protein, partial [Quisquiliibacterium sp.]
RYAFVTLDYITILDEMETFLSALKEINPGAKVLLTVSPVPLTATAADRHVLLSTMASKSILRAIADKLYQRHAHVDYFPSYDIIMSPPYRGMFFKNNLRSIHEEGVDYVMSHFFDQHRLHSAATAPTIAAAANQTTTPNCGTCESADDAEEDDEAFCDEAFLELERNQTAP